MANRFLRLPAVQSRTGYSASTIWRQVKTGDFPKPVSIGPNATAWIEKEVDDWMQSRISASRGQQAAA
jgi:prophage regulatory protein